MTTLDNADVPAVPGWLTFLLAASCGLIVANIYYAQPLAGPISADLKMPEAAAGLIVTLTQIGYVAGLIFVVPLGDLIENRKLITGVIVLGAVALLGAGLSTGVATYLAAALLIGIGSVSVQIILPYSAHLFPEAIRGRMLGNVMSGLLLGIMLARPISSFIAGISSWHVVFYASSALMILLALTLHYVLPPRVPVARLKYSQLLGSMLQLALTTPVLHRRALYQAGLFGAFSLFWTTVPLLLAGPKFHLSQFGIALFALAGAGGAVAAPIAGRVADKGWTRPATLLAILAVAVAFLATHIGQPGSRLSLTVLVAAAILLDFGVQANVVLGQRAIFALGAESRSRLNGLYMATFFTAAAIGSALGGWAFAKGGWTLSSWIGFALPVAALIYALTESRGVGVREATA